MTKYKLMSILLLLLLVSGCYLPMSGRVIDAETKQPIEGAVVLVEWTRTHGIGEHWTESYKVAEVLSDKDGKVKLPGCYFPFIGPPDVTIYKKGYVAWNNRYIFPNSDHRTDFEWGSGYVFKMEKFLSSYSYLDHRLFINRAARTNLAPENKEIFFRYYFESESREVQDEQKEKDKSRGLTQ
jgi:hypothetical protein